MESYYAQMKEDQGIAIDCTSETNDPKYDMLMRKARPKTDGKTFEEFLKHQTNQVMKGLPRSRKGSR